MNSKTRRLVLLAVAVASSLAIAAPASASPPKGIYSRFADCPTNTPAVTLCMYGQTTGGEVAIGNARVPFDKTITVQGGGIPTSTLNRYYFVPGKDGSSLSNTELSIPGGLAGFLGCDEIQGHGLLGIVARAACKALAHSPLGNVSVITEPVATEHNPAIFDVVSLYFEERTAMALPIRVHLENKLLGPSCYIGSATDPIELDLTTGTTSPPSPNTPIKGSAGTVFVEEEDENQILGLEGASLVDNSFSAPAAIGCGGALASVIDPLVNRKLGLPSAAGRNTAIMQGTFRLVGAEYVRASEQS